MEESGGRERLGSMERRGGGSLSPARAPPEGGGGPKQRRAASKPKQRCPALSFAFVPASMGLWSRAICMNSKTSFVVDMPEQTIHVAPRHVMRAVTRMGAQVGRPAGRGFRVSCVFFFSPASRRCGAWEGGGGSAALASGLGLALDRLAVLVQLGLGLGLQSGGLRQGKAAAGHSKEAGVSPQGAAPQGGQGASQAPLAPPARLPPACPLARSRSPRRAAARGAWPSRCSGRRPPSCSTSSRASRAAPARGPVGEGEARGGARGWGGSPSEGKRGARASASEGWTECRSDPHSVMV